MVSHEGRPQTAQGRGYPLLPVLALGLAGFMTMTTSLAPTGMLTLIAADLRVSVALAGTMTSAFALALVLVVLPFTRLTMRLPRRRVVVAALLLLVASNTVVALAPNLPVALVGRFLGGAAHGVLWAAMPAVVAAIAEPRATGRAIAVAFAGNSVSMAAGAPLCSLLGFAVGWRVTLGLLSVVSLVTAVVLWRVLPAVRPGEQQRSVGLVAAIRRPGVLRIAVSRGLMMLGHFSVLTFISPFLQYRGVGAATAGLALSALGVAGVVTVNVAGRVPRGRLLPAVLVATTAMPVAFGALGLVAGPPLVILGLLLVWGGANAAAVMLSQQAALVAGYRATETAMSVLIMFTQAGIALGAGVAGVGIRLVGVGVVPWIGLTLVLLSLPLLAGVGRVLERAGREQERVTLDTTDFVHNIRTSDVPPKSRRTG